MGFVLFESGLDVDPLLRHSDRSQSMYRLRYPIIIRWQYDELLFEQISVALTI
jgi:hypothetical protein